MQVYDGIGTPRQLLHATVKTFYFKSLDSLRSLSGDPLV